MCREPMATSAALIVLRGPVASFAPPCPPTSTGHHQVNTMRQPRSAGVSPRMVRGALTSPDRNRANSCAVGQGGRRGQGVGMVVLRARVRERAYTMGSVRFFPLSTLDTLTAKPWCTFPVLLTPDLCPDHALTRRRV